MTPGTPNPKALLLFTLALPALAQTTHKPTPQQSVTVVVVNAHAQPASPVPTVRVSLSYVDNGTRVTDAREVTNRSGEAYLTVSTDAAQRGDLRLEISGVSDLVIYQPADGQLTGLPGRITLNLLPKGSPALLGPTQIEALLHRTLLQNSSLQKQNQALKNQKPDLSAALAEVAQAYGFPAADFDKQVQQWAQQVQGDPGADPRKKALAEVALKHYAEAAQLFTQATNADAADMDADEQKFLEARRTKLRQLLTDAQQSANASQLNLQYHQATATLAAARDRAAAEQIRYPDDQALHAIWLDATFALAYSRLREGEVSPAEQSLSLLARAVDDFLLLAQQFEAEGDRTGWAETQINLGLALVDEAERASGDEAAAMFDQAVQACRNAQTVFTKTDSPGQWAKGQNNLGNALLGEGERTIGDKAATLLDQAVQSYRSELEVYTKAEFPADWAMAQNNLGLALTDEGVRGGEDNAVALFDRAVQAFHSALEVYTRADLPQNWAVAQNNIGNAFLQEGIFSNGEKSAAALEQAEHAYRSALELRTRASVPQEWAATQLNLGSALLVEGEHASGDTSAGLLDQALHAYRNALEVYTKTTDPYHWAQAMRGLSLGYNAQGNAAAAQQALADANSVSPQ